MKVFPDGSARCKSSEYDRRSCAKMNPGALIFIAVVAIGIEAVVYFLGP